MQKFITVYQNICKFKLHLIPLLLTILNIAFALFFTITFSFLVEDINKSGKIRFLQERIKMCYFAKNVKQVHINGNITLNDVVTCLSDNTEDMSTIMDNLYNNYKSNIFISDKNEINDLFYSVNKYLNLTSKEIITLELIIQIVNESEIVLSIADSFTEHLVDLAKLIFHIIIGLMGFMIVSQIYYNINTILLQKDKKRKYEIHVENKSINQICHELRSSILPFDMYVRELNDYIHYDQNIQLLSNNMQKCISEFDYILKRRLDFIKIMNKSYEPVLAPVFLIQNIKSYIPTYLAYGEANNKNITINIIYEKQFQNYQCQLDQYLFHNIVTNLFRNSVKFSKTDEKNDIKVLININSDKHIDKISIQFDDTGIGFNSKDKPNEDSYGLGLVFVKNILKLFKNGKLSYKNKYNNKGAIVNLYFEIDTSLIVFNTNIADYEYEIDESIEESYYADSYQSYESYDNVYRKNSNIDIEEIEWYNDIKVTIIDDNMVILKTVEKTIKKISQNLWDVKTYENGEQYLDYLKNIELKLDVLDILIIDQNMESSGGILKGTELIEKLYEKYKKSTYIMMSGNDIVCNVPNVYIWGKPLPNNETIHMTILNSINSNID